MKENTSHSKWSVGWGFSELCNMDCSFCYSRKTRSKYAERRSLQSAKAFISKNSEKIKSINWGTGENTLDPLWWELIDWVKQEYPFIKHALTTNGSLFTCVKNSLIKESIALRSISEIDVSLDFSEEYLHNNYRGVQKAYSMALNCMKWSVQNEKLTTLVMVGTSQTLKLENIRGLLKLARGLGVLLRINLLREIFPMPELRPSPQNILNALKVVMEQSVIIGISDPLFSSFFNIEPSTPTTFDRSCRILPNGGITPSTYLVSNDWIGYNIYNNDVSFSKLQSSEEFKRFNNTTIPSRCKDLGCRYQLSCRGGSHDRRWLTFKSFSHPDPFCPIFDDNCKVDFSNWRIVTKKVSTVHEDYLPTLIFKPC